MVNNVENKCPFCSLGNEDEIDVFTNHVINHHNVIAQLLVVLQHSNRLQNLITKKQQKTLSKLLVQWTGTYNVDAIVFEILSQYVLKADFNGILSVDLFTFLKICN